MSNAPKRQELPRPVITQEDVDTGAMVTMEQIVGSMFPPIDATAEEVEALHARPNVTEYMEAIQLREWRENELREWRESETAKFAAKLFS